MEEIMVITEHLQPSLRLMQQLLGAQFNTLTVVQIQCSQDIRVKKTVYYFPRQQNDEADVYKKFVVECVMSQNHQNSDLQSS